MCTCLKQLCLQEQMKRPTSLMNLTPEQSFDQLRLDVYSDQPWQGDGRTVRLRLTDVNNGARQYVSQLQPGYFLAIGRDPAQCQVIIDFEPSVSRHQCDIYLQDGPARIAVEGSLEGKFRVGMESPGVFTTGGVLVASTTDTVIPVEQHGFYIVSIKGDVFKIAI